MNQKQFLSFNENFSKSSIVNGVLLEKPVQTEALRAYDQAVEAGHRSFLLIGPTAMGKSFVFSRALLKELEQWNGEKKLSLSLWISMFTGIWFHPLSPCFLMRPITTGPIRPENPWRVWLEDSGAFLFGSTATPVHHGVRLTDLFDVNHFSYLRDGDLSGSVSRKILLQLSRAIEKGDITGFDDIYVLGETLFKRSGVEELQDPLFVKERESGYQVINPHYYNRLVEVLSPILLSNRRGFIVTASIREAERLSEYLNGVFGESLVFSPFHSGMSKVERKKVLARSKEDSDQSHYIVSVRALDEGVDLPKLSAYIDLNSNVSVKQMLHRIGRVLRLSPGKLESDIVLLSDYKNRRLSEDLLELLDAMNLVPGFRSNGRIRNRTLSVEASQGIVTREGLSVSRELLEEVARSYWGRGVEGLKVDYETFVSRVKEAVEKGELDPNRIGEGYREWQEKHPDMPPDPRRYYKGQFEGWSELKDGLSFI